VRLEILGANGQLGRALRAEFPDAMALWADGLDVANPEAVREHDWTDVEVVLNATGYTKVDAAEEPANAGRAQAVNADAVGYLAEAAPRHGFTLVHISTEYVFDGTHAGPIPETLEPSPLSVYGRTKAEGDRHAATVDRHYIVRPTWLVGDGKNFVRTMATLADRGISPSVVDDQIGRLTFTNDVATGIRHLLETGAPFGTYNLTCEGDPGSWADVAEEVFVARGRKADDVRRVSTHAYFSDNPAAAPRPRNSVLDLSKIEGVGFRPGEWREGLSRFLAELPAGSE
jgi:dTDP-4-dehydrorhamnose 3,5-epimerase